MYSFTCISFRWPCPVLSALSNSSFTCDVQVLTHIPPPPLHSLTLHSIVNYFEKCFCSEVFVLTKINLNMALLSLASAQPNHGNWSISWWCVVRLLISIFRDIIYGWKTPCLEAQRQNWGVSFPLSLCVCSVNFYKNHIWKLEIRTSSFLICADSKEIFYAHS